MCRLPAFLRTLAACDGRRVETLVETARCLREAGYLPPSKRGVGATPVDDIQAANLLIACMTCDQPSAAPRALEVYRGLKNKFRGGFGKGLPSLELVARCETFGQAMSTLIAVAPNLKAEAIRVLATLYDIHSPERLLALDAVVIEVTVSRPVPHAQLSLKIANEVGIPTEMFSAEWVLDSERLIGGGYGPELQAGQADRRTTTTITHRTIFKLADLIADPAEDDEAVEELSYA